MLATPAQWGSEFTTTDDIHRVFTVNFSWPYAHDVFAVHERACCGRRGRSTRHAGGPQSGAHRCSGACSPDSLASDSRALDSRPPRTRVCFPRLRSLACGHVNLPPRWDCCIVALVSIDDCELTVSALLMCAGKRYPKSGVLAHQARPPCITRSALPTCKGSSGSSAIWPRNLHLNRQLISALGLQIP